MKQQHFIFYFISSFSFIFSTTGFSQNILTQEDSLLFIQSAKLDKAYSIFDKTQKPNFLDKEAICTKAAIYLQKGAFNKAFNLINTYPIDLKDDINAFHLNYFTALVTLAQGNKNDAFKRLKAIHAQSLYKDDAERLLAHFFKSEEED